MNDEAIVDRLRAEAGRLTAVELADLLATLTGSAISQGSIVTYFKRAFPVVPLRVLLNAGAWVRVSGGDLTDEGFNELVRPWIGRSAHRGSPDT